MLKWIILWMKEHMKHFINQLLDKRWNQPIRRWLTSLSAAMAPRTSSRSVIGRCRRFVSPSTNEKTVSMSADARRLSAAPKAPFQRRHSWVSASFSQSVSNTTDPTTRSAWSSEICSSSFCRDSKASWAKKVSVVGLPGHHLLIISLYFLQQNDHKQEVQVHK